MEYLKYDAIPIWLETDFYLMTNNLKWNEFIAC